MQSLARPENPHSPAEFVRGIPLAGLTKKRKIGIILFVRQEAKENRMGLVSTTKMSSKGQVVIPEDIRRRLALDTGTQFLVLGEDDVVILKMVRPPAKADFDCLVKKARRQARAAGLTRRKVSAVVSRVRRQR
jgi:AbrB family looped-hinge helix DNA binding protein